MRLRMNGFGRDDLYAKREHSESETREELEILIEYFDRSTEMIRLTHNLEKLQKMMADSLSTGASMNFIDMSPPFSINPKWVKKVTIKKLG